MKRFKMVKIKFKHRRAAGSSSNNGGGRLQMFGNRPARSARSRRQNQGEATGRVGIRQSFDYRTLRYMESPGVYHIVVCIGPTAHVDLDRLPAQPGLAFYQVQEECRRPRRGEREV